MGIFWLVWYGCSVNSDTTFVFANGERSEFDCDDFPTYADCTEAEKTDTGLGAIISEQAPPEECDEPMGIRKIVPDNDDRVPVNTHVFVSLIGNGDDSHATISLLDSANQSIEVSTESACYYHESDTEFHCSYMVEPLEDLEPNTNYRVRVQGTSEHHDPSWRYDSTFRTTSEESNLSSQAPELEILRYEERAPGGLDPCDWRGVYKYELIVELADPQSSDLSLIQVYEVNGSAEELVHSLIVQEGDSAMEFRQVLNPGTEGNRCYRAFHMDLAGNESASSSVVCWE